MRVAGWLLPLPLLLCAAAVPCQVVVCCFQSEASAAVLRADASDAARGALDTEIAGLRDDIARRVEHAAAQEAARASAADALAAEQARSATMEQQARGCAGNDDAID